MQRQHGSLARYVKIRVAHAPGMPETFSPPTRVRDPDMHHGTLDNKSSLARVKRLDVERAALPLY